MLLTLIPRMGVLYPADQQTADQIAKLKSGVGLTVSAKKANNVLFHRKLMALANFAFEHWTPEVQEYKGQVVAKDFDRFRKDITILAGFGRPIYNIRGEVRFEADSWSFASMDSDKREALYKAILNVIWKHIMSKSGYLTPEDMDKTIEELLRYD